MKTHPILFSDAMILGLLENRKTQTRRIMKPQPTEFDNDGWPLAYFADRDEIDRMGCPYGKPGKSLLWVRETWAIAECGNRVSVKPEAWPKGWPTERLQYIADRQGLKGLCWNKRSSIHMPRWASRLTLELTEVRVERLQDIREEDAIAEGIQVDECGHAIHQDDDIAWGSAKGAYAELWESINGPGSWTRNDWVWILSFRVHHCNIDTYLKGKAA